MKVKIISCFNEEWWHSQYIGQEVDTVEWSHDAYFVHGVEECGAVIPKRDCSKKEYNPWTKEEESILLEMRNEGLKVSYIARKLKKTEISVYNKLCYMNMVSEYNYWGELWDIAQEMKAQGKSYREIGLAIGKNTETVRQKFIRERKKLKGIK